MNYKLLLYGGNSGRPSSGDGMTDSQRERLRLAAKAHNAWVSVSYATANVSAGRAAANAVSKEDSDLVAAEVVKGIVDKKKYGDFSISDVSGKMFATNSNAQDVYELKFDAYAYAEDGGNPDRAWIVNQRNKNNDSAYYGRIDEQYRFASPSKAVDFVHKKLTKR